MNKRREEAIKEMQMYTSSMKKFPQVIKKR
jgi:hypothetical protein